MAVHVDRLWAGQVPPGWEVTVTATRSHVEVPPPLELSDERDLVGACVEGRREAFDVIVDRHQRAIYQLCYRFVGNHEDASELAQDVFVRAYRGLKNFKSDSSLATWLYRIGVNVCLNRVTARRPRMEPLERVPQVDAYSASPADGVFRAERTARVRVALAKLPPKQRATLILRVYHELPHRDIARILGSSVGAVKANVFHALANLKKILQSESS